MNYSQAKQAHGGSRAPIVVRELKPEHFAQTWDARPTEPVKVGLKLLSEIDERNATAEAEQQVTKFDHDDIENNLVAYNSILMGSLVSRALCNESDIKLPCGIFPIQSHELLIQALTSSTLRWLFEELEKAKVSSGVLHIEATDDDLEELKDLLDPQLLVSLPRGKEKLVRRFARFMLEEMIEPEA